MAHPDTCELPSRTELHASWLRIHAALLTRPIEEPGWTVKKKKVINHVTAHCFWYIY